MKTYNLKVQNQVKYRTVPEVVTDILRKAILAGELQGGEQLKQEDLAASLKVSLSPIRESLKNLEAEGLVEFFPNKGAIVTRLSAEEAQEIFEIRLLLESGAIKLSLPNLNDKDFAEAERILGQADCEECREKWSELNWQFHKVLYKGANKPRLLNLIQVMHNNVERYMCLYLLTMNYQRKSQVEHRKLLGACVRGDIKTAQKVLERHMGEASKNLIQYLAKLEERP